MFEKSVKFIVLILFSAAFISATANAQSLSKTGTTAAKFLSVGVGPRANGMGGAFSAVSNDVSALYWNPAGIAGLNRYETIFTYTKMFADINLNYFAIAMPFDDFGTIGVSVTALDYGEMEITTELDPEGIGTTFSAGSYAFGLSYARYITKDFAVGATFKYIRESIMNSSADGFAFDIGTVFLTPFWGIKFASSITNFGTKMQMTGDDLLVRYDQDPTTSGNNETVDAHLATDQFELPLKLQIGISREFKFLENQSLLLAIDANYPNDNKQWVNIGGELKLFSNLIYLRAGYKTLFLEESQEGLTLGFGLNYEGLGVLGLSVDYAYQQYKYLGNNHSFGIILRF